MLSLPLLYCFSTVVIMLYALVSYSYITLYKLSVLIVFVRSSHVFWSVSVITLHYRSLLDASIVQVVCVSFLVHSLKPKHVGLLCWQDSVVCSQM